MLTCEWAKRAKDRWLLQRDRGYQGYLFGIVQGNFYRALRELSAAQIASLDFPGIAIGGLSIGEPKDSYIEYLEYTSALLPSDKPHYLMGIGTPDYIIEAVRNGIDIFDCVLPTRLARHSSAFTHAGRINLMNAGFARDHQPIEPGCLCSTCQSFSRAYIRHLLVAKEMLAATLISIHNIQFLVTLMKQSRPGDPGR